MMRTMSSDAMPKTKLETVGLPATEKLERMAKPSSMEKVVRVNSASSSSSSSSTEVGIEIRPPNVVRCLMHALYDQVRVRSMRVISEIATIYKFRRVAAMGLRQVPGMIKRGNNGIVNWEVRMCKDVGGRIRR